MTFDKALRVKIKRTWSGVEKSWYMCRNSARRVEQLLPMVMCDNMTTPSASKALTGNMLVI